MNFKDSSSPKDFNPITINVYIALHKKNNPNTNIDRLRKDLNHFKALKLQGQKCDCGNPIWIIGSAISGWDCFTCIAGETDSSDDFEII